MRKSLLIGALTLAACSHQTQVLPSPASSGAAGSAAARPAVDAFLAAVHSQDLQAMSAVWGDKEGPVRESKHISRDDVEKREVVMMRCFRHDSYRVLGNSPAADGERVFQVELTRGTLRRTTNFYVTRGADRYYVRTADMEPVRDLCSGR